MSHLYGEQYTGYWTETIFIEAPAFPSVYKTHTVTGEVGVPDFCFTETEANASSPEEVLFNETFDKYFFNTNKIFNENYSKLSLKEKMKFAYKMLDVAESDPVYKVCKKLIDKYAWAESGLASFALSILREFSIADTLSNEFGIQDYKSYLIELSKRPDDYRVYGFAEFILILRDGDNKVQRLENIYNKYSDHNLKELSLFHQFLHYYSLNEQKKFASILDIMSSEFPSSRYLYQAHLLLNDEGFDISGYNSLLKSNDNNPAHNKTASITEPNIPFTYNLLQNYPNPFNPITTIKYEIPEASFITIAIYDANGSLIKNLVNKAQSAGSYKVLFNGSNLASGIYFYHLKTGNGITKTGKMVLMK